MDLRELYEKVSSKAEEEREKLGFATILEAVGHRRNLFYSAQRKTRELAPVDG